MGKGLEDKDGIEMLTKCYFCKGKVLKQMVDVDFWWGGKLTVFENVPAEVCQQCGEKYFSPEVYKEMETLATYGATPSRYITVNVVKFEPLAPTL
jgi:YgiT-type zinc finger domain-containing protein